MPTLASSLLSGLIQSRICSEPLSLILIQKKFIFLIELMDPFGLWSAQLPEVIKGYFADMRSRLAAVYSILKPNGRCAIVVGNSAYAGVIIPSDLLLAKTAEKVGFKIERIEVCRHLTTSSQQRRRLLPVKEYMREFVIHLLRC